MVVRKVLFICRNLIHCTKKTHIHKENRVWIMNYIYISSASSFNHPSELQLTCLDLHEIDFQSPELRHWTNLHPSRLVQVALSAANHFCTTAWSEVPRWTRSCWVRISCVVSQGGKNERSVGEANNQTPFTNLTWLKVILAMIPWFPPFLNPIFGVKLGEVRQNAKFHLAIDHDTNVYYVKLSWVISSSATLISRLVCPYSVLPWYLLFFTSPYEGQLGFRWSSFAWKTLGQGAMRYLGNGRR